MTSPTSTIAVTTRDELISFLEEAAELEHGLCCSYLYAAFSLRTGDPTLTPAQAVAVQRWSDVIVGIAVEEMLHLGLVANLLTSIGGNAHFGRPVLPQRSRYYPGGISISLRRFEDATVSRFMYFERPASQRIEAEIVRDGDVDLHMDGPEAAPGSLTPAAELRADPDSLSTVGKLYETIGQGFVELGERLGPPVLFVGDPRCQADDRMFPLPGITPVTDLASAQDALATLVHQGEGASDDWAEAHYGQFRRIRDELRQHLGADPGFDPAWPCVANPVGSDEIPSDEQTPITSATARDLLTLFNSSYTVMTAILHRCFSPGAGEDRAVAEMLAATALCLMSGVVAPVGRHLATIPLVNDAPGMTAGASFEIHRAPVLTAGDRTTRLLLGERLDELAHLARRMCEQPGCSIESVPPLLDDLARRVRG